MSDVRLPRRTAYLRPGTIGAWSSDDLRRWAGTAAEAGIGGVVTKITSIDDNVVAVMADAGLEIIGSFTCYSDHEPATAIADGIHPIGSDGRPLAPMEWYRGLVPGDPSYDERLAERFALLIDERRTRLVFLDFLRWPGHWELESRAGGSPRPSSFDVGTLRRFNVYLDAHGMDATDIDPVDAAASARVIARRYAEEWEAFRASVIVESATRLAGIAHAGDTQVGAFLVPIPHSKRLAEYGQDVRQLAESVDVFAIMSYQGMVGLTADSTLDLADETARTSGRPVLAMLQTSTHSIYTSGSDWGTPLASEAVHVTAATLDAAAHNGRIAGHCSFPGEAPLPSFDFDLITTVTDPEGTVR
jgi:hypothetical protein